MSRPGELGPQPDPVACAELVRLTDKKIKSGRPHAVRGVSRSGRRQQRFGRLSR